MREAAAAFVPILFAIMLFGILAESASANFKPYQPPQITILSPSSSETYNSSSISLNVRVQLFGVYAWAYDDVTSLNYSLDGQQDVPLSFARSSGGITLHGNGTTGTIWGDQYRKSRLAPVHVQATEKYIPTGYDESLLPTPSPSPSPTASPTPAPDGYAANLPIILSVVAVIVIVAIAGLAVYHKKPKKNEGFFRYSAGTVVLCGDYGPIV